MPQTERQADAFFSLLANNTEGNISPQDLRDAFASMMGYGGMQLNIAAAPVTMNEVGDTYVLMDVFSEITGRSIDVNLFGTDVELAPDYKVIFNTVGLYFVSFHASFTSSANNKLITFRPHINGVPGNTEVDRFAATGMDAGSAGLSTILLADALDECDIRVKIDSGSSDLTFLSASCSVFRVG